MPVEVRVPTLGESIVEATVGRWLKSEGDAVVSGEPLVELETDKVNVEITAEQDGVLQRIAHPEGDTVNVGEVIAVVAESQVAGSRPVANGAAASRNGEAKPAPAVAEEGTSVTPVARKLAADNDIDLRQVKGSGPNARITKEDVADYIGRQAVVSAPPQAVAKTADETPPAVSQPQPAPVQAPSEPVLAPVGQTPAPIRDPAPKPRPATVSAGAGGERREERVRMTRRRQTIAARLVEAQRTAAMLTTFNEIDMSAVMELRKRRKDSFKERHGVGLGFMSFFTKATVGALKTFPFLNAEIQGEEIIVKRYFDIGIAVGAEEGLVVPVVRDADRLTFADIERQIGDLAGRAKAGKLTLADLQGGTFTITNGGVFGSLMSTPILNTPQVGILGMHKIEERPVVVSGEIVIRPMMYVALSYDHRIVDGGEAVRFLVRIKELIEDPESLLLEG